MKANRQTDFDRGVVAQLANHLVIAIEIARNCAAIKSVQSRDVCFHESTRFFTHGN
jgi:hypothetical protein